MDIPTSVLTGLTSAQLPNQWEEVTRLDPAVLTGLTSAQLPNNVILGLGWDVSLNGPDFGPTSQRTGRRCLATFAVLTGQTSAQLPNSLCRCR